MKKYTKITKKFKKRKQLQKQRTKKGGGWLDDIPNLIPGYQSKHDVALSRGRAALKSNNERGKAKWEIARDLVYRPLAATRAQRRPMDLAAMVRGELEREKERTRKMELANEREAAELREREAQRDVRLATRVQARRRGHAVREKERTRKMELANAREYLQKKQSNLQRGREWQHRKWQRVGRTQAQVELVLSLLTQFSDNTCPDEQDDWLLLLKVYVDNEIAHRNLPQSPGKLTIFDNNTLEEIQLTEILRKTLCRESWDLQMLKSGIFSLSPFRSRSDYERVEKAIQLLLNTCFKTNKMRKLTCISAYEYKKNFLEHVKQIKEIHPDSVNEVSKVNQVAIYVFSRFFPWYWERTLNDLSRAEAQTAINRQSWADTGNSVDASTSVPIKGVKEVVRHTAEAFTPLLDGAGRLANQLGRPVEQALTGIGAGIGEGAGRLLKAVPGTLGSGYETLAAIHRRHAEQADPVQTRSRKPPPPPPPGASAARRPSAPPAAPPSALPPSAPEPPEYQLPVPPPLSVAQAPSVPSHEPDQDDLPVAPLPALTHIPTAEDEDDEAIITNVRTREQRDAEGRLNAINLDDEDEVEYEVKDIIPKPEEQQEEPEEPPFYDVTQDYVTPFTTPGTGEMIHHTPRYTAQEEGEEEGEQTEPPEEFDGGDKYKTHHNKKSKKGRQGKKSRKSRKGRQGKKSRKSRKGRQGKKSRKSKKGRQGKKSRKYRKGKKGKQSRKN